MKTIIIALFPLAIALNGCQTEGDFISPEVKGITEAVYASGNLYPKSEYKVFAHTDGTITELLVKEGDSIRNGQLICRIDNEASLARKNSASAIYQTAMKNYGKDSPAIQELESLLGTARIKKQNDSLNFARYARLIETGAVSMADFEKARLASAQSDNEYQARKASLEKLRNQLYIELQQAEANHKINRKEDEHFYLKSLINGRVYELLKEKGEMARRNEAVALIGSDKHFVIHLQVDELDINKIKPGQMVLAKLDVMGEQVYEAKVTKIYPKLNKQTQSFKVEVEFTGEVPSDYYGISVEANIIVEEKENTLVIPKSALVGSDSLWIVRGGQEVKVRIVKGAETLDFVEILEGLDIGSKIIIRK